MKENTKKTVPFGGYDFPEEVIARIVNLCCYTAIHSLAKTSQGLRRIVGYTRPPISVNSLEIHFKTTILTCKMETEDEKLQFQYRKHRKGYGLEKLELHLRYLPFYQKIGSCGIQATSHWKAAKKLDLGDSVFDGFVKDLVNFDEAKVRMSEISMNGLVQLRNAFLASETFQKFELSQIFFNEFLFFELFGPPMFLLEGDAGLWIYGDSESKHILSMIRNEKKITFSREDWDKSAEKFSSVEVMTDVLEKVESVFKSTVSTKSIFKMMQNERFKNELISISVQIDIKKASLSLELDKYSIITFNYSDHDDGCWIYGNKERKVMEGRDFISVLCEDLEEVLKFRQPILRNFQVFLHLEKSFDINNINERQEYVSNKFLKEFKEIMKRKRDFIKTRQFNMNPISQEQLLEVLSYLQPGHLEVISLHSNQQSSSLTRNRFELQKLLDQLPAETRSMFSSEEGLKNLMELAPRLPKELFDGFRLESIEEPVYLEMDEILKLDQWKRAKAVITDNLIVVMTVYSLLNFENADVRLKSVSSDELLLLEKIQKSGGPINLTIGYEHFADHSLNNISHKNPFELFGIPNKSYTDEKKRIVKEWSFPTNDNEIDGFIRHRSDKTFWFHTTKKRVIKEEKIIDGDWTGLVLLANVFPVIMENILEVADLRSRLNLRKVCRDLRNFIDDTRIKTISRRIKIAVQFNAIEAEFVENGESNTIFYKGDEDGCILMRKQKNLKIKTVNNLDYFSVFFNDLDSVFGNPRSSLEELSIDFPCFIEEQQEVYNALGIEMLSRLEIYLENRCFKLSVKKISIQLFRQSQFLHILPFINPDNLEKIELINRKGIEEKLDVEEILKLDQWKKAKELELRDFFISLEAEELMHFEKVKCCVESIGVQNLLKLKKACINSPKEFLIDCHTFDTEDLYDCLGRPLVQTTEGTKTRSWFFRIPNTPESVVSLVIESLSSVKFSRCPVPKIGVVTD